MLRATALFERYATGSVSYRDLETETGIPADGIRAILGSRCTTAGLYAPTHLADASADPDAAIVALQDLEVT